MVALPPCSTHSSANSANERSPGHEHPHHRHAEHTVLFRSVGTTNWDSGGATTVTLKLVNANTEALGNDFAVDDIYLGTDTTMPGPK